MFLHKKTIEMEFHRDLETIKWIHVWNLELGLIFNAWHQIQLSNTCLYAKWIVEGIIGFQHRKKKLHHPIMPSGFDLQITLSISMSLVSLNSTYDTVWWNYYLLILSKWHQQEVDYSSEWISLWICMPFMRRLGYYCTF